MKVRKVAPNVTNLATCHNKAKLILAAISLVGLTFAGCVIVPSPALEEEVSMPSQGTQEQLKPGESIVIFESFEKSRRLESCLTNSLDGQKPPVEMVEFEDFREALYPWFEPGTFPSSFEALQKTLHHNRANKKLKSLNVRYLIQVKGVRASGEASGLPPWTILPAGVMWAREDYDMTAAIWDLKRIEQLEDASVGYYGYAGLLNYIVLFGVALPPLKTSTCNALAEKLHAFLTGREAVTSSTVEGSEE